MEPDRLLGTMTAVAKDRWSRRTRAIALAAVLLAGARTLGQAPPVAAPPAQASSAAIDLSGYWTPALHEDSTERGAGPEMADYSGLPLNEAGRLFALSITVHW